MTLSPSDPLKREDAARRDDSAAPREPGGADIHGFQTPRAPEEDRPAPLAEGPDGPCGCPAPQRPETDDARPDSRSLCAGTEAPVGNKLFLWFFMGLLLFSLFLLYSLMRPFLHTIILACVFSALSHPLYKRCLRFTGGRRVPAALIVLLGVTVLVVIPICLFVAGLIPQARISIAAVNQWLGDAHIGDTFTRYVDPALQWVQDRFPELNLAAMDIRGSILAASRNIGQYLLSSGTYILGNTLLFFAHALLIMLIMFFLLIDGEALVRKLEYLCPLKPRQTAVVIESLRRMSRAVLVGGFCVAALQGLVGGIGFALVGIPALFWGTVMVFAALVPVVGTGLVWVPAVIVLLLKESFGEALFLTLWCGVGVTSIDSILRPLLMRDGAKVPVLFIFMSILGGVNVFGMLGLLYGPMILGLVAVMLDIYGEEYQSILESRKLSPKQEE